MYGWRKIFNSGFAGFFIHREFQNFDMMGFDALSYPEDLRVAFPFGSLNESMGRGSSAISQSNYSSTQYNFHTPRTYKPTLPNHKDISPMGRCPRFCILDCITNGRKRHNREGTIFGNNPHGRRGKLTCDHCRRRKSKVTSTIPAKLS